MKNKNQIVPDQARLEAILAQQYAAMPLDKLLEMRDRLATQLDVMDGIIAEKSLGFGVPGDE